MMLRSKMTRSGNNSSVAKVLACLMFVLVLLAMSSHEAFAESRLYHLRVTLRSGHRYETISTHDPINYCHANGGSVVWLRDYSLIYSPEMKVKVLRTWVDTNENLASHWHEILRRNNMLRNKNHKRLPRLEPLTLSDLQQPE